jgi:pyruvate/2-oxoglutarate dehydrogenase complex dihydrolipoamide dehydrogenase (E3) component
LKLAFNEDSSRCCCEVEQALIEKNINIITNTKLEEIVGDGMISGVALSDGKELKADALIVGVGVKPNIDLAEKSGLEVDKSGITVDDTMRTSDPSIFACGDCAKKTSFFTGKPSGLRLASIATTEARIAGANLFSTRRRNAGVVGVFSTAIGNLTVGCAGLSEKCATENGFEVETGEAEAADRHPGKMPGMSNLWVRLVFNKVNGELLGGTVQGGPSAGELINTISACIQKRMTADDIATFQIGTHPAVTASPIAYQLVNAAEMALKGMRIG